MLYYAFFYRQRYWHFVLTEGVRPSRHCLWLLICWHTCTVTFMQRFLSGKCTIVSFSVAQRSFSVRNFPSPAPVKQTHAATPYKRPAAAPSPRRRLSSSYWHETVESTGVSHLNKTQLERQEVSETLTRNLLKQMLWLLLITPNCCHFVLKIITWKFCMINIACKYLYYFTTFSWIQLTVLCYFIIPPQQSGDLLIIEIPIGSKRVLQ